VLVIDLDPQASSTWVLGIDPATVSSSTVDVLAKAPLADAVVPSSWSDLVELVPASARLQAGEDGKPTRLRRALRRDGLDRYDAVLVDCPPSNANLTINALTAARHALVVVEPSALGLRGIGTLADTIDRVWDQHNPRLELSGVVLNRVPGVSTEAERRIAELELIVGRTTIWRPFVPQRVVFNRAVGERRPIHSYGAGAGEAIEAFDLLWRRLRDVVRSSGGPPP
jgi:chromosome partitioning protein